MEKYKIISLIGPAGSGKDSILRHLVNKYPDKFNEIVSCTTRPPREGEVDGVNYHFLTISQFTEKVVNGDMLEATEFNNWHYGTSLSSLSKDKINVGVFNPAGVYCMMGNPAIELTVYYVRAGDKERLLRQLNREECPNVNEIIRRFQADERDFSDLSDIGYKSLVNITNEHIQACVNKILDDIV